MDSSSEFKLTVSEDIIKSYIIPRLIEFEFDLKFTCDVKSSGFSITGEKTGSKIWLTSNVLAPGVGSLISQKIFSFGILDLAMII